MEIASDTSAKIYWYSLPEGKLKSRSEDKPMMIDFAYSGRCPRCAKMSKNVYSNPLIINELNREFVPVKVDLSKDLSPEEKEIGDKYGFNNDCLLVFLDPQGNLIEDDGGKKMCFADYIGPDWFLDYLKQIKRRLRKK